MVRRLGSKKDKKGGGTSFKYHKRSSDDIKKRAEATGGRFDSPFKPGFDMFRPKVGESLIRILPPTWDDHDHYGLDVWMHRFIGGDNSNYLCLNKMKNKPCPACDEAKAAKDAGEDDEAKALQPQKRTLVWVLDRDEKSQTPQLWDMSWAQDRDIAQLTRNDRTGKVLLIDHPDDGYDITVKRTGQGLKTRYQFIVDRDPSPIHDDEDKQEEILAYITENPLPDVLRFDTAEHIEKQLSGTSASKDDLDDDDDKPKRRGRGRDDDDEDEKPKKRRGRDSDDDEEEEKPRKRRGRDDDDEEEEKPKRRSRSDDDDEEEEKPRRRSRSSDDDEEEEKPKSKKRSRDADDDDEEEEKPKRRSRSSDDDDEEEEKPKRRSRSSDDDDDEEEEKPKKKRRAAEDDDDEEEEKPRRRR